MTAAPRLTFDVVIATRNRPEALALSIPLLLGQSRLPERLIVIDSSDDHAPVRQVVEEVTAGHAVRVIVEPSARGLARQRKRGLEHVRADVAFFPDDDSLFHPGTSAAIMEVYERDAEGRVAAVGPAEASEPPAGVLEASAYRMTAAHRSEARLIRLRRSFDALTPDLNPRFYIGRRLVARAPELPWMAELDAVHVEWLSGFRMSFRTEVIRAVGFEPLFGGYSLFEDIDASWAASAHGCVVGARRGRIYHHRFPSGRPDRRAYGAMMFANMAFLMAKHAVDRGLSAAERRAARRRTLVYMRLRMLAARLKADRKSVV